MRELIYAPRYKRARDLAKSGGQSCDAANSPTADPFSVLRLLAIQRGGSSWAGVHPLSTVLYEAGGRATRMGLRFAPPRSVREPRDTRLPRIVMRVLRTARRLLKTTPAPAKFSDGTVADIFSSEWLWAAFTTGWRFM